MHILTLASHPIVLAAFAQAQAAVAQAAAEQAAAELAAAERAAAEAAAQQAAAALAAAQQAAAQQAAAEQAAAEAAAEAAAQAPPAQAMAQALILAPPPPDIHDLVEGLQGVVLQDAYVALDGQLVCRSTYNANHRGDGWDAGDFYTSAATGARIHRFAQLPHEEQFRRRRCNGFGHMRAACPN